MRKKIILSLTLFLFIFSSCVTLNLEKQLKKLNPTIGGWYELHEVLMESKVPQWIDERGKSEKMHFLRLPQKMQLRYIQMFWEIRTEGIGEEYYNRIAMANRSYREGKPGWKTDRGKVLILCGFPQYRRYITIYDLALRNQSNPNWQQPAYSNEGYVYETWTYYQQGCPTQYVFKYRSGNTWDRNYSSVINLGNQTRFERECRKLFAPTEEGWDLWGGILLQWVREND